MEMAFLLKGLNCPNCAAKIEHEIGKVDGVISARVNLMNETLKLTLSSGYSGDISAAVRRIVASHEPDVLVKPSGNRAMAEAPRADDSAKRAIVRIAAGTFIYVLGIAAGASRYSGSFLELGLLIAAYAVLGGEVAIKAARNVAKGRVFDENFLMSVASVGAFVIGEYPEAVAVMLFYQVGEMLQNAAVRRSKKSIADLMDIRPDSATVIRDGELTVVGPETVTVGEVIVVKPGEKIPLDGVVIDGSSTLDTKALTGESAPRAIGKGDTALSGCINQNGVLRIKVTKGFAESTAAKIIDLVQNAANRKAPTENFITTFSRHYTPFVVGFAALLAVVPPLLNLGEWADWIHRGLVFLVISCPCALVISIPLGFFAGIGAASRKGVLVKGGNYLEALNNLDIVVFDKTGTLTKGVFEVSEIIPANGYSEDGTLALAASAEAYSNHPIAQSIRGVREDAAGNSAVGESVSGDYSEIPGQGVRVNIGGKEILAGNEKLMAARGVAYTPVSKTGTKVYVAESGRFAGCVVISDGIKPDSGVTVSALRRLGVRKTVMLTGDDGQIAESVASELGLDEVYSGLLPDQKVEKLERLDGEKRPKKKLAFVGDGINDAPVLARADVGIAMGGLGSDAAIEAADVVLMTDEPSKLIGAITTARATKRVVLQNIVFSLGVKGLFLILASFGAAGMWEAICGDVGVMLLAVLNAMRVLKNRETF
ncbi:MAG: cadmium-translocating P-type ATPase [Synergistaceae bacterium]|jgi:Cd2+/Zn2+-exporting ATPase|nr:cadmium-translocating P-type ATPase [Synergistaceae bacterium]